MGDSLQSGLEQLSRQLTSTSPPPFGHRCKKLFSFDHDYFNLNNGSFGTCPNHVVAAHNVYLAESERRPDEWFRFGYKPSLHQARTELAQLVHCPVDDLVLLTNATTGVNAVLRGLSGHWVNGDAILVFQTVYGACGKTAQYIVDSNPTLKLQLVEVPLRYPLSHKEFLQRAEEALQKAQRDGIRIRIAILDAISSLPGVVVPWEKAVQLLRKYGVLSLVDGAHAVGQIPLQLQQANPDFFISNCHKWLMAHRGCAFLYAPKRTQHYVVGMPTSHFYVTPGAPAASGPPLLQTTATSNYVAVWESNGTQDLSNFLSVPAALEFRRWLGGEAKIMAYTSNLARRAGEILTQRLGQGSRVMDVAGNEQQGRLTASMVNVSIPYDRSKVDPKRYPAVAFVANHLQTRLHTCFNTFVPFYVHDDTVWIRVSAQVWLEESDFVWLADRLQEVLRQERWQVDARSTAKL